MNRREMFGWLVVVSLITGACSTDEPPKPPKLSHREAKNDAERLSVKDQTSIRASGNARSQEQKPEIEPGGARSAGAVKTAADGESAGGANGGGTSGESGGGVSASANGGATPDVDAAADDEEDIEDTEVTSDGAQGPGPAPTTESPPPTPNPPANVCISAEIAAAIRSSTEAHPRVNVRFNRTLGTLQPSTAARKVIYLLWLDADGETTAQEVVSGARGKTAAYPSNDACYAVSVWGLAFFYDADRFLYETKADRVAGINAVGALQVTP